MNNQDRLLIAAIENGLPISSRPYAQIGEKIGLSESQVIERLSLLKQQGFIKRHGVIVKHRQLGYQANAMVVWNIPDEQVKSYGLKLSQVDFVTLCYRRPRYPHWLYNLYCMIHGKNRDTVMQQIQQLIQQCDLESFQYQILFSRRCFKQRGAIYRKELTHE